MPNEDNLIPNNKRSPNEVRKNGRKGGIKSGQVRRAKKDLRNALEMLLEKEYVDKKGVTKSGAELIAFKQFEKALQGDSRAFEVVRDTAGQKPVEKVVIAEVDQDVINEVERMVNE